MKNDKIAALGPKGTYTEVATKAMFPGSAIEYAETVEDVFMKVKKEGLVGVVPIENSLEGSVNSTLDCLLENDLFIIGEAVLEIRLCIAAAAREGRIDSIISHPHALAQCRRFLREKFPQAVLQGRTSTAAAMMEAKEKMRVAAIGPRETALYDGLEILYEDVQDSRSQTRFIAVSDKPGTGQKTSIIFSLKDEAGALYSVLGEFAKREINLKKIESRPSRKGLGDYVFYVDFEGSTTEPAVESLMSSLKDKTASLKVLGSY